MTKFVHLKLIILFNSLTEKLKIAGDLDLDICRRQDCFQRLSVQPHHMTDFIPIRWSARQPAGGNIGGGQGLERGVARTQLHLGTGE